MKAKLHEASIGTGIELLRVMSAEGCDRELFDRLSMSHLLVRRMLGSIEGLFQIEGQVFFISEAWCMHRVDVSTWAKVVMLRDMPGTDLEDPWHVAEQFVKAQDRLPVRFRKHDIVFPSDVDVDKFNVDMMPGITHMSSETGWTICKYIGGNRFEDRSVRIVRRITT